MEKCLVFLQAVDLNFALEIQKKIDIFEIVKTKGTVVN